MAKKEGYKFLRCDKIWEGTRGEDKWEITEGKVFFFSDRYNMYRTGTMICVLCRTGTTYMDRTGTTYKDRILHIWIGQVLHI